MGRFVKGDVVVAPFPFSDLSNTKKRPAVVVAVLAGSDVLLCQSTSKNIAEGRIILYRAGVLTAGKIQEVVDGIVEIVSR